MDHDQGDEPLTNVERERERQRFASIQEQRRTTDRLRNFVIVLSVLVGIQIMLLVSQTVNDFGRDVATTKDQVTVNTDGFKCLLEQMEEHRVTNLDSHQQIAAGEHPPVTIDGSNRFNGQFHSPSPQLLQKMQDQLGPSCDRFAPGLVAQK